MFLRVFINRICIDWNRVRNPGKFSTVFEFLSHSGTRSNKDTRWRRSWVEQLDTEAGTGFGVYADRRTIRCLYSKGGGGRARSGGMNRNLGENFIVYSRRVSTYKCPPRAIGNEIVNVRKGGGGCSVTVLRRGKRMPRRWRRAHDENRCILLPA